MKIKRLKALHKFLSRLNLNESNFSMASWHDGTKMCAIGWAMFNPKFNRKGFSASLTPFYGRQLTLIPQYIDPKTEEIFTGFSAVGMFFGLDYDDCSYLFSESSYTRGYSIIDVLTRIDNFIEKAEAKVSV